MSLPISIIVYTVLVFATSAIGALTGIGGGVIRKPVFDAMGDFNAAEIAFLNVLTVLAMSLTSILRQSKNFCFVGLKKPPNQAELPLLETAAAEAAPKEDKRPVLNILSLALLSLGSVAGGVGGEFLFDAIVKGAPDATVKLVQNSVLLVLTVLVLFYMIFKNKIPTARLTHPVWYVAAGFLLGILASFLGIGGGPMNLAVLMLMFSMSAKEAAFCSLAVILVSQISKLIISAILGSILVVTAPLVYTSVAFLVLGAVIGGLVGSALSKKMSDKAVTTSFNLLQLALIGVIIFNIVRSAVA